VAVSQQVDQLQVNQLARILIGIVNHEVKRALLVSLLEAVLRLVAVLVNNESLNATLASSLVGINFLGRFLNFVAEPVLEPFSIYLVE